jgi:hypothetical protein
MATKIETEARLNELRQELKGIELDYQFLIPGWEPEQAAMGFRWFQSQLWEGFYVAYKIDHNTKIVQLNEPPRVSWRLFGLSSSRSLLSVCE